MIAEPTRTPWDSLNSRLDAPGGLQLTLFEELALAGQQHREARDAALELLELADVDDDRLVAEAREELRAARAAGRDEQLRAAEQHDVRARTPPAPRRSAGTTDGSSTTGGQPTTVPSGSAVTADLRCRTLPTGTATTVRAARLEDRAQLLDARRVRARRSARRRPSSRREHVAAVERRRRLDPRDLQAEPGEHVLDARPARRAAPSAPGRVTTATPS